MKKIIYSATYQGTLQAPASKSYLQRAIALACLAEGTSIIEGYTPSKDVDAAIRIIREMGARVLIENDKLTIEGVGLPTKKMVLNCGESGLSTRMFSPIAAITNQEILITGEGSLLSRPMHMIEVALTKLGKHVQTTNGTLPITLSGDLKSGKIVVDGSESSQLITGLLMALPLLKTDSELHVMNPTSIPYIRMTLDILADFGIHVSHENYSIYRIAARQKVNPTKYNVEGDWSGAAFHLVAAAIAGEVKLLNLNLKSAQADREILTAIESCGAKLVKVENEIFVSKNQLNAFQFDATHCPDLFPPLAALAACCNGVSEIKGVSRLKNKESDRGISIQSEFEKLGIQVEIKEDVMHIHAGKVKGGIVHSHNDHRMAMALAVLGLVGENAVEIDGAEAVAKSYPGFFEDFEKLIS